MTHSDVRHDSFVCAGISKDHCAVPEATVPSLLPCRHSRCVAVRCSALQCVAECSSVLLCVAVRCSMPCRKRLFHLYCPAGTPGVLQSVAVCCRVLQCFAVCCSVLQCVAVCCSVLQIVAVCCSVIQCVAVCCSVSQCAAHSVSILPRTLLAPEVQGVAGCCRCVAGCCRCVTGCCRYCRVLK